jgi:hypothetical protein
MSMKMMKKVVMGSIGAAAMIAAAGVQADTIAPGPGSYTFTGSTTLDKPGAPTITCNLTLNGDVAYAPDANGNGITDDGVTIDVNSGSLSGGFLCGFVSLNLSSNPWYASDVGSATPQKVTTLPSPRLGTTEQVQFNNINVSIIGYGSCTDTIVVDYTNGASVGDPSQFVFTGAPITPNGGCTVTGTLNATSDVDVFL